VAGEALDPVTALAAYTVGAAWHNGDAGRGSLLPGSLADLVVFDRDPFSEGVFTGTEVDQVMVRGETVYRKGET
jgi:predicted amidohydrolase YtcJ